MSSSVFFRFKSQKEPIRVAFDGTGISVFELKREIITLSRLGDGTDFELLISSEDNNQEYDDDTTIIPRSTTVIAKRLPAIRPGRGGAARYVSGKMPQAAKTSQRSEHSPLKNTTASTNISSGTPGAQIPANQTEEERTAAILQLGADQWAQQQQEMVNATPINRNPNPKTKNTNAPNHPPPHGYVCHRCEQPGHYIQNCPTNDDPAYDNRPRVKRTTGIPRSFLKTIEKPTLQEDDSSDESKRPMGVMMNSEGEWVVAEPDQAAFDRYQAKAKASAAANEAATQGSKDLQDKGLECPIDQRLFVEPTRTPCCQTVYCHECITNSLLENDLRCPSCSTENILIDDLKVDNEMVRKVGAYEEEQRAAPATSVKGSEDLFKPKDENRPTLSLLSSIPLVSKSREASPASVTSGSRGKKRSAESDIVNTRTPPPPAMSQSKSTQGIVAESSTASPRDKSKAPVSRQLSTTAAAASQENMFPGATGMMSLPMPMTPNMPMMPGMLDPVMMQCMSGTNGNWSNAWDPALQQQMLGQFPNAFNNGMMLGTGFNQATMPMVLGNTYSGMGTNAIEMQNQNYTSTGHGTFSYQQRHNYGPQGSNDEDSAYFRKPVNPHRHHARKHVNRPADYREI